MLMPFCPLQKFYIQSYGSSVSWKLEIKSSFSINTSKMIPKKKERGRRRENALNLGFPVLTTWFLPTQAHWSTDWHPKNQDNHLLEHSSFTTMSATGENYTSSPKIFVQSEYKKGTSVEKTMTKPWQFKNRTRTIYVPLRMYIKVLLCSVNKCLPNWIVVHPKLIATASTINQIPQQNWLEKLYLRFLKIYWTILSTI